MEKNAGRQAPPCTPPLLSSLRTVQNLRGGVPQDVGLPTLSERVGKKERQQTERGDESGEWAVVPTICELFICSKPVWTFLRNKTSPCLQVTP